MKEVAIIVNGTKEIVKVEQILLGSAKDVVIQAAPQTKYILTNFSNKVAPESVLTQRIDDNLVISFDNQGTLDSLVIEDFYTSPNTDLIGLAQDGSYYSYLPESGVVAESATQLSTMSPPSLQVLGGNEITSPWWTTAESIVTTTTSMSNGAIPWILGGSAILGTGLALGSGSDSKDDQPQEMPTPDTSISKPTLTIDDITADNELNHTELTQDTITVTGSIDNIDADVDPAKTTVTLSINGKDITATVDGNNFSADIATADLKEVNNLTAQVSVTDTATNTATSEVVTKDYTVDATVPDTSISKPTIVIDDITADNELNHTELAQDTITVTGSIDNLDADVDPNKTTVTLSINGKDITATVDGNNFSADIATADLKAVTNLIAQVSVTDTANNTATSEVVTKDYTVDATVPDTSISKPTLTIDDITDDNILTNSELANATVTVKGNISNLDNDLDTSKTKVILMVNGKSIEATVTNDTFSADVSTADLKADSSITAQVNIADKVGNETSSEIAEHNYTIAALPIIKVNNVTADNIINSNESDTEIAVSGTVENVKDGTIITLTVGQAKYTGEIDQGAFIVIVDGKSLANHQKVEATLTDALNQTVTESHNYAVDTEIAKPVITINSVTQDDLVNYKEAAGDITITGSVTNVNDGEVITIAVGSVRQSTTVKDEKFSIDIDGGLIANNTVITADITTQDAAGNTAASSSTHNYTVDLTKPTPVIEIDNVTDDNTLNITESLTPVNVSGSVKGLKAGESIKVSCGCPACSGVEWKDILTKVDADGNFDVEFSGADVAKGTEIKVSVAEGTDNATTETSKDYAKDLEAPNATIELNEVTQDGIMNSEESKSQVTITGTIGGIETGADTKVVVTVGNETFEATISDSKNTFTVDVDGRILALNTQVSADIEITDKAGNKGVATATKDYQVDTSVSALIMFDDIAGDNIVSLIEADQNITLTGKVTGEFTKDNSIALTVGEKTYNTTVSTDGRFSVDVDGSELVNNSDKAIKATLVAIDSVGNTATINGISDKYTVEKVDVVLSLNTVTNDNEINVSELKESITISGKADKATAGDIIEIIVGSNTYEAEVKLDSTFSVDVIGQNLAAVDNYEIKAQLKDDSTVKATQNYNVMNYVAADIQIDNIETSHLLSNQEQLIRLSGKLDFSNTEYAIGANGSRIKAINLMIGDNTYNVGINEETQYFYADVELSDLEKAEGQDIRYTLETSDKILNIVDLDYGYDHTIEVAAAPEVNDSNTSITFNNTEFDGETIISAKDDKFEVNTDVIDNQSLTIISGHTTGSAKAGDNVSIEVNGQTVATTVRNDGSFTVEVALNDVTSSTASTITAILTTTDLADKVITVQDDTIHIHRSADDSTMVNWTGMVNNFDDLPYFIQSLDIQTYYSQSYGVGYLDNHEHGNQNGTHEITYHFADRVDAVGYQNSQGDFLLNPVEYTSTNKAVVREGLALFEKYLDINFTLVNSMQDADITYFMADINGGTLGNAYTAGYANIGGNVHLAAEVYGDDDANDPNQGSLDSFDGFSTVVHETMHTMAATHSFYQQGDSDPGLYLPENIDSLGVTLMSYDDWNDFNESRDLRIYDLAYLQYRFGVNPDARSGDDTYTFMTFNQVKADGDIYIWDGAGVDTFDASNEAQGVYINLTPGSDIYNNTANMNDKAFAVQGELVSSASEYFDEIDPNDEYVVIEDVDPASDTFAVYDEVEVEYDFTEGHSFIGYGTQIERLYGSNFNDILVGNKANNAIYANAGDDRIDGGLGHDYIDGGLGADIMTGGEGNDIFVVNVSEDVVIEIFDNGEDSVFSSADSYTMHDNVENLVLVNQAISGTGNDLDNIIEGNNLDNTLVGNVGDDTLIGGTGSDTLTGGTGADTFILADMLNGDIDIITDFNSGQSDVIQLDSSVFTSLSMGNSVMNHIAYDASTGKLTYDSDANGGIDPIHFATLSTGLDINDTSFVVI